MGHQFQQLMMGMACLCTGVWSPGWKESKSRVTGQVESGISWRCLHLYMVVVMLLSAGPQLVVLTTVIVQGLSLWLGLPHNMATSK